MKYIHEREIWLLDLEPTKGVEVKKVRPCLVLRRFSGNHFVILPITTKIQLKPYLMILPLLDFFKEPNCINLAQIRTVDEVRFIRRFGKVPESFFYEVKQKTAEVFQLLPQGAFTPKID